MAIAGILAGTVKALAIGSAKGSKVQKARKIFAIKKGMGGDEKEDSSPGAIVKAQPLIPKSTGAPPPAPKAEIVKVEGSNPLADSIRVVQVSVQDLGSTMKDFVAFKVKDKAEKQKAKTIAARSFAERFKALKKGFDKGMGVAKDKIPFFDRIMNFVKAVVGGALILYLVENLGRFLQWTVDTVYPFVIQVAPYVGLGGQVSELERQMEDLQRTVDDLKVAQGQLPSGSGSAAPPQQQAPGGYGPTGGAPVGAGEDLRRIIAGGEGGVNSVNRGRSGDTPGGAKSIFGKNLTDMTVDEIHAAQKAGKVSAVGKYQIIGITMPGFIKYLKNKGIDTSKVKFTENIQDMFMDYVINHKRPIIGKYLRGETDNVEEAGQALAREFASVGLQYAEDGKVRGQSRYAGVGGNAASIRPETVTRALQAERARYASPLPPQQQPPQSALPALPPTNTIRGRQHFGASRDGGARKHAGVDFDAPPNGVFYSRIGGVVTQSYNAGGGYGNVVDIYNANLNVTERIAEGDVRLVKVGDRVAAGQPVQKGTNQSGVFHYEIRPGKKTTYGYGTAIDPTKFLIELDKKAPERDKKVSYTPSYDQPQTQVAFVPVPVKSGPQVAGGSGGAVMPSRGTTLRERVNSSQISNQYGALYSA